MSHENIRKRKTNDNPASRKLHYAWVIAFAGLFISGAGIGIFNSCVGVFVKPVCEDLGFTRGEFTLYSSISTLVSLLLMPAFGSLFRRFGYKRIAIVGATVCGLSLIGFSFSSHLWQFYTLGLVSGSLINGVGIMSIGILVNRWFIDKKGLATGIAFSGTGLVAAVLIPIANRFIELNGWRWTYRFLAFVSLCLLISVILFVVSDKPEDMGLEPYRSNGGGKKNEPSGVGQNAGLTREEAVRTGAFWLLAISALGITLCQAGPHVHTVSFLSDIGYSASYAAAIASVYMLMLTACKVGMGFMLDRLGALKGSMLIGGCCVLFPVLALLAAFPAAPWVYALVLAMASSGSTVLGIILTTNYFGGKDFARVYSIISMFSYIGVAISSPLLGSIYDMTGSYSHAWVLIIGIGVVVCICLLGANRMSRKLVFSTDEGSEMPVKYPYEPVNADEKVLNVVKHPAFEGFGRFLFPLVDKMPDPGMKLDDIGRLLYYHADIDANTTVKVINYMLDEVNAGKTIFYDIHSEQDKKNFPKTKDTGLFFFRGKPGAPFAG
jgi:MFS family permease